MSRGDHASDIDKSIRVIAVVKAILQGYTKRAFLLQFIADKYQSWGVSERQIDNYIHDAKKMIQNSYSVEDLEIEKDIALSRLESLFTMNMKIQDYRECRTVTMDRMKLLNLLTEKVEVTAEVNIPVIKWVNQ